MSYRNYQIAAKMIFTYTFLLASIAAGAYCVLAYFDFKKEIPFEWEYLAALGGVVAIGAFLAICLRCIASGIKKKEARRMDLDGEEQKISPCAGQAVESDCIYIQQSACMPTCYHANVNLSLFGKKNGEGIDTKRLKKVARIAIPAVAVTAVAAVALAARARKKRKIRRLLDDLARALGYRR